VTLPTCTRCHQPLTAPVWSESGAPYGLTCARRMGLVRDAQRRDPAAGGVRVRATRATRADERQAALPFVAPWEALGVAPALWPTVVESRARCAALGLVGTPGCEGCELWGVCAWCATSEATRAEWLRRAPKPRTAEASGENTNGPALPGRPVVPAT